MFKRAKYHLPKFESPQISGLYTRYRLYDLLDNLASKRVLWISAPAGSGKTSLIASYLTDRKKKNIWYQVDAGDGDIASFFHHMALCIKNVQPKKRGMLPDFTSEHLVGLPAFSVNYFRELFRKIKPGSVLVLDNFQDAGEDVTLHEVMQHFVNEVPVDAQVIVLSRVDLPATLVQLQVSDTFTLLSLNDIQFNRSESDEVAKLRSENELSDIQYERLYDLTQGWAAGLVLTLAHLKIDPSFLSHRQFSDRNTLFHYVAKEIVSKFDEATQNFLLKTSFLIRISSSVAKKLTGESRTIQILKNLSAHQLLTIQHNQIDGSFEYHPLLREFLVQQAKQRYPENDLVALQNKAGELLINEGDIQAAAQLFMNVENWDKLSTLIKNHAYVLIQKGLFYTVEHWINACPREVITKDNWLYYWQANCQAQYQPVKARSLLQKVHELFLEKKDTKGVYLTWCNLIESYIMVWDTLTPIKELIRHYYKINKQINVPGLELKARVAVNMTAAMTYTWLEHEDYAKWLRKTEYFYLLIPIKQVRGLIGLVLGFVYYTRADMRKLIKTNETMRLLLDSDNVTASVKLGIYYNITLQSVMLADINTIKQTVQNALALSKSTGVHIFDRMFKLQTSNTYLLSNNNTAALNELENIRHMGISPNDGFYGFFVFVEGRVALERGHYDEAITYFTEVDSYSVKCGFPYSGIELMLAITHILQERVDKGISILKKYETGFSGINLYSLEFIINSYLAYAFHIKGDQITAENYLYNAFKGSQSCHFYCAPVWCYHVFNVLAVLALDLDIDKRYLREFIRRNSLTPPTEQRFLKNWPWRVKIFSMGRFSVLLDDNPVDTDGRPFDLLKVLLSFGGRNAAEDKIMDALWPDADGDQAQANFKTTLHRLRKLFGELDILQLSNHKLSLNDQYCWVDTWSLSRLFEQTQSLPAEASVEFASDVAKKLLEAYKGHFLANESDGWSIQQRESLRMQFVRHTGSLAEHLEPHDPTLPILCYQRLLEIDPFIEVAYQGLIRTYQRQGRQAEAQATYQRCKDLFANTGAELSQRTKSLLY